MKAIAPGKIILSGEHAVVHGLPALAMAVDRFAEASVIKTPSADMVAFDILNLSYHKEHTLNALRRLKHRLSEDYQKFLRGEYGIRDVLKRPFELSQYALTSILEKLNLSPQEGGIKLSTHSNIPLGCGMGSSAAMILSVMHAIREHYNIEVNQENFLSYGMEIENLQHGRSSGLDLQVSLSGGCLHSEGDVITKRPTPNTPMYLVNTGKPESTTGECVEHSKAYFSDDNIKNDFANTTQQMDSGLAANDIVKIKQSVRDNHQLLISIGVVPQKTQHFIKDLEQTGAAAKICGAGSIQGDKAGMVLIIADQSPADLCNKYGFECTPVKGESNGLRTI